MKRTKQKLKQIQSCSDISQNLVAKKKQMNKIIGQFNNILESQRKNRVKQLIKKALGDNYPQTLTDQCNFKQQWQKNYKLRAFQKSVFCFKQSSPIYFFLNFFLLIFLTIVLWYSTVRRIFEYYQIDWIFSGIICFAIFNFVTFYFQNKNFRTNIWAYTQKQVIYLATQIYYIIYSILTISQLLNIHWAMSFLDVIFLILLWQRFSIIYGLFRKILISSKHKKQLNLLHMLLTLFIIGHTFSLLIHLLIYVDPINNWTKALTLDLSSFGNQYISALYFAMTTMLTVGYGDLTPVNTIQFLLILVIEVFGVVTFAYVISEIGSTLSQMRKSQLALQDSVSLIEHLSNYYGLGKDLTLKARDYISANVSKYAQINTEDENNLLGKLSQQLRQQITYQTNNRLMNRSLFFISHWTKNFRNQIAQHLTKKVLSPNQAISQVYGEQNIYILQKGTLNLFIERFHRGKCCLRKNIKSICSKIESQILLNVYGYSFAITDKPIKLSAVANDTVVSYILSKHNFLNVIKQQTHNLEYYNELRAKMELTKMSESFQVPELKSYRQHYYPNIQFLLFKQRVSRQKQLRGKKLRKKSRKQMQNKQQHNIINQFLCVGRQQQLNSRQGLSAKRISGSSKGVFPSSRRISTSTRCPTIINLDQSQYSKDKQFQVEILKKFNIQKDFDIQRQYRNFFPNLNLKNVIYSMQNKNFQLKRPKKPNSIMKNKNLQRRLSIKISNNTQK